MSPGEYEYEPVPGLPGRLPAGEQLLWQGRPHWLLLARYAYRVDWLAGYFLLIALWRAAALARGGADLGTALASMLMPLLLGLAVCALLAGVAWLAARCTVYSLTNRRVVLRHGIAVPMALNLPFAQVQSAALARRRGGGDVSLRLVDGQRIGYLVNWPHVRPGCFAQPQATFRALRDPDGAASLLAAALASSVATAPASDPTPAVAPSPPRPHPTARPATGRAAA